MRKTNKLPAMWFDDVLVPQSLPTWFSGENMLWTPAIHVLEKKTNLLLSWTPGREWRRLSISVIGGKLISRRKEGRIWG